MSRITGILASALALAITGPAAVSSAAVVDVSPSNLNGWTCVNDNTDAAEPCNLVPGPVGQPLGEGSVNLTTPTADGHIIGTFAHSGTMLSDINGLDYWTFQTGPTLAISLQFDIRYQPTDVGYGGRLVFEPYQTAGIVGSGWQHWDAYAGKWWASKTAAINGSNGKCPQANPCTWAEVLGEFPSAQILPGGAGRLLLKAGGGWAGFTGSADALTISTLSNGPTTYDFDRNPCATVCYVNKLTGSNLNDGDTPATALQTVQAGINAVASGGTVKVAAGTYNENVSINKPMTLEGAKVNTSTGGRTGGAPDESTIAAAVSAAAIQVSAPDVSILGMSVSNHSLGATASGIEFKSGAHRGFVKQTIVDGVDTPVSGGTAQAIYLSGGPDDVSLVANRLTNVKADRSTKGVLVGDSGATNPSVNFFMQDDEISNIESAVRGAYGVQVNNGNGATANSGLAILDTSITNLKSGGWIHAIGLEANTPNAQIMRNVISGFTAAGADQAAVWFEANPSYATAHVNKNSLDVGSAAHGIAVGVSPAGFVDGSCNWWGDASGPSAVGPGTGSKVSGSVKYIGWLKSTDVNGACNGGAPFISPLPGDAKYNGGFTPTVVFAGDGAKTVTSSTPAVCTVADGGAGSVTFTGVGTCSLTAHAAAGNTNNAIDGEEQSFDVGKADPSVSINNLPGSGIFGGSFNPTYSNTGDGAENTTSSTTAVCTVSGGTVNYVGVGTCTLVAHSAETALYNAANGPDQPFQVGKATPSITINNLPSSVEYPSASYTPTYTYNGDGMTSVTSNTNSVCTVSGTQVQFVGAGICTLVAHGSEGTNWTAVNGAPQSFAVVQTARGSKSDALDELNAIGPTGSKDTDKRIAEAIEKITTSLARPNWVDNNRIDGKKADKIFEDEKQAAKKLMDIKGTAPAGVADAIDDLLTADRMLAQTAIDDMAGGDPKKLAEANKEMAKAQADRDKGHYDSAIEHYRNAWKQAQKA